MSLRTIFWFGAMVCLALPLMAAQPIFDTAVLYPVGQGPTAIVSADFNNDGYPDLAVADSASNTVSVLLNAAQEGFLPAVSYPVETGPVSIAAGDLNGDNSPDLVVANLASNTLSILWNARNGTFPSSTQFPVGSGPRAVAVGQLNDGGLDIIVGHKDGRDFWVFHGDNEGAFVEAAEYFIDDAVSDICLLQYNLDNFMDILVCDSGNVAYVYANDQTGLFTVRRKLGCAADAWDAAVGDFDNDGFVDIASVVDEFGTEVTFIATYEGDLEWCGGFFSYMGLPRSIVAGDYNRDERDDVAFASLDDDEVKVATSAWDEDDTSDRVFNTPYSYSVGDSPRSVAQGDFDNDGDLDLAVANSGSNDVAVLTNYLCGDLNGDHTVDLADITGLIGIVYLGGELSVIKRAANVDSSTDREITLADITGLISYVYLGGTEPVCSQ